MSVKFFGQFLLNRRVVSREQLLDGLLLQGDRNQPLGMYAVKQGYITHEQAERINVAQRGIDERFGDLAIELRLLTRGQVDELLLMQRNDHIRLGEALVELGHIDTAALEREVEAFRADQAAFETGIIEFPPDTPDSAMLSIPVDLTAKMLMRVAGVRTKIEAARSLSDLPDDALVTASISFSGAINSEYVLSVSKDIAVTIARRMTGEDSVSNDLVEDAIKEMCNVVCGNAVGKFAQSGRRVEITPPLTGAPMMREGDKGVYVQLKPTEGTVELRICNEVVA